MSSTAALLYDTHPCPETRAASARAPSAAVTHLPLEPLLPSPAQPAVRWGQLYGSAPALALAAAVARASGPLLIVTADVRRAEQLHADLDWLLAGQDLPVLAFPDWETLPYDAFSPHQDIVSERLATLERLPRLSRGAVVVAAQTLLNRLPPRSHLEAHSFQLSVGERLDLAALRARLERSGYRAVAQVMEHGEFAVRGALVDVFPMGSDQPLRIDLLDDEIESLRGFDPETQLSTARLGKVALLPARECPLGEGDVREFRTRWRARFSGDPSRAAIYRQVSDGVSPGGIEYWLALFFADTSALFDHLPPGALLVDAGGMDAALSTAWDEVLARHDQLGHDLERPLLDPHEAFHPLPELAARCAALPRITLDSFEVLAESGAGYRNYGSQTPPLMLLDSRADDPAHRLVDFVAGFPGRVLLLAESAGRRETLVDLLRNRGLGAEVHQDLAHFLTSDARLGLTIAPCADGVHLPGLGLSLVAEPQLFGEKVRQRARRAGRDPEAILRDLTDLAEGAPVVHEEHGVGRYRGLAVFESDGVAGEYLTLEYAGGDKLYVPVAALQLVTRYTGSSPESAPLHKLGSGDWNRARRKAAEQARDAAAELLEVHARRAARSGAPLAATPHDVAMFAAGFPFDETNDQRSAIAAVQADLASGRPMDRVVCGDVGFGKTEVALRAAFAAVQGGRQVAVLVPTTLLAQQHAQTFRDRFADWPVRIGVLSRFTQGKDTARTLAALADGTLDLVIGTHALLSPEVRFHDLGLVIVDEEHRFGVRHKERLKQLRAEVHLLTLTATPIPRTLNMALAGIRDLSIIATPPVARLAVKTFVAEWQDALLREACLREIKRGGQVYFVHNAIETIERTAEALRRLLPEAELRVAHGQMRETELEQTMLDFYHRRFNLLLCTTIIESGIDVPTANTIIIDRADKLGLAQLHQLRGRVGRSHHRAYAYLLTPPRAALSRDAQARLEAVESLEELGAGFTLATHDLEIRGAGELLGEEQSGQIQAVGFALYAELLERAVAALKRGEVPDLDAGAHHGPEVDLRLPALLPDDYVPDVHLRLVTYKRIAGAADADALAELQVELVDRFGPLPAPAKLLFRYAGLRQQAEPLGIQRIEAGPTAGRLHFRPRSSVEPRRIVELVQREPKRYRLEGGTRLRFQAEMADPEVRLATVARLLGRLRGDATPG
jgi:transcription-repair coupling factor (superfamily II helicase)